MPLKIAGLNVGPRLPSTEGRQARQTPAPGDRTPRQGRTRDAQFGGLPDLARPTATAGQGLRRRAQLPPHGAQRARGGEPEHGGGGNPPDFSQAGMQEMMRQQSEMMLATTRLQNEMTMCQTACKLIEQGPKAAMNLIQ
ncbi:hypothetical protein [Ralstonia pseudosolanacearum]|uniref:hypothetical protein n=1 Tax=Ralstonia pseudosolanacearum TaxID=1310165 RepID=UPI0018D15AAE|nr:hypothetical protein [Ralstonia pseudosolanacearum]